MGVVFKARREEGPVVALKTIRAEHLNNAAAIDRLRREAQAIGRLSHPHLIPVVEVGDVNGKPYLVMEYVDGLDLAQLVKQQGPLRVGQAADFVRQAAIGLQYVHERGLVHRDIKPSNLLLSRSDQQIRVLDLGVARVLSGLLGDSTVTDLTESGVLLGTLDYMAPEQATNAHAVDIRADIYSLGCVLYFLLAGRPPFHEASPVQKIFLHQQDAPPPLETLRNSLPADLTAVVRKMMARQPDGRHQTPAAVAEALAKSCHAGG
jgi:serine/threonine-protein kinase